MFGVKKRRINDLETRLKNGEEQYNLLVKELNTLRSRFDSLGAGEVLQIQDALNHLQAQYQEQQAHLGHLSETVAARQYELNQLESQIAASKQELGNLGFQLQEVTGLFESGLTEYTNPARSAIQLKDELEVLRGKIKSALKSKTATRATENFTFNNSRAKGQKFVADMSKMMLRAYNAEAENCILTAKAGGIDRALNRLDRVRQQVCNLGKMIDLQIDAYYHELRRREITLTVWYQDAKKEEKEAEREERARLREEKKAQQELESRRKELDKERQHYLTVLDSLRAQGREDEANEVEARVNELNSEIEQVYFRAANVRAGYVYVISNIGAFGENMVKIGMTRRLEPMDRVRELGDASVPFGFDVHALFFSEDAVGVEAELHRRFAEQRVNKINLRREFFYVTPQQVREQLLQISGNLLEFTEEPEAEQFRLSKAMSQE